MSRPTTTEQRILAEASLSLQVFSSSYEEQMLVIEMSAALNGGFDIDDYWAAEGIFIEKQDYGRIQDAAIILREEIIKTGIPFPVAVSSLSRKPIPVSEQKKEGAFYTDYRLSSIVSSICKDRLFQDVTVADIAAGTGILLASCASSYFQVYPQSYNTWIAKKVFAFDLSPEALRGAMASLASLSNSVKAIMEMRANWATVDSLTSDIFSNRSFDIVIGNPPWGKVKLSRHQFSIEQGLGHVYGSDYGSLDLSSYEQEKAIKEKYIQLLKEKYSLLGESDTDVYVAFLQKSLSILAPNGKLVYIIPAGLIRSKGTTELRKYVFNQFSDIVINLFDNKARFFSIDTRFKFLIISLTNTQESQPQVVLKNFRDNYLQGAIPESISINKAELLRHRKDFSIPEVASSDELKLFFKISNNGVLSSYNNISICRELDMTNDKPHFDSGLSSKGYPVIEGRMVQPYRIGSKRYLSGSGRKAVWKPTIKGLYPQFTINPEFILEEIQGRIAHKRVGFCDIAGQTNERSMMAAIIPENVVCGNKVPTLLFEGDDAEDRMYLWLGIVNSLVFDWMLRRVLTTTVNYFLLQSIPLPCIDIHGQEARKIINNAQRLSEMGEDYYTNSNLMGDLRAEIDALVAQAYHLQFEDLLMVLEDFPLMDRGQASYEENCSITKALILAYGDRVLNKRVDSDYDKIVNQLKNLGAKPYVLYEMRELFT